MRYSGMAKKKKTSQKAAQNATPRRRSRKRSQTPVRPIPRIAGEPGRPPTGTEDWTPTFLGALEEGLHVRDAAQLANVHFSVVYRRRKGDEAFRNAWAESEELGTQFFEAEAGRRAYHGTLKPVYYKGEVCGDIREYSDQLLMFLLRARLPDFYRDNARYEHVG